MLVKACILPFCLIYAQPTENSGTAGGVDVDSGLGNDGYDQTESQSNSAEGGHSHSQESHDSGFGQQQERQQQTIAMSPVFWTVIAVFAMWWVAPLVRPRTSKFDGNAIKLGGSRSQADSRKGIAGRHASGSKVSAKPSHSDVVRVGMELSDFMDVFDVSTAEAEQALEQVLISQCCIL